MRKIFVLFLLFLAGYVGAEGVYPRVVSLAPSITEIIYAVGGEEHLVGVTTACDYPPEVRSKAEVGDFGRPSLEAILALKPDVVLVDAVQDVRVLEELRGFGVEVVRLSSQSISDVLDAILTVGEVVGKRKEAESFAEGIRKEIGRIKKRVSKLPPVKVYIELWHDPLISCGAQSFINDLVKVAGGVNIASCQKRGYFLISSEFIISSNPQVIVLAYKGADPRTVRKREGWAEIDAVKRSRVYKMDPDLLARPGVRIAEALEELARLLHPEAFKHEDDKT